MASVVIRGIDDDVKERIRGRARRNKRSLEAELRSILEAVAREEREASEPSSSEEGFGSRMAKLFGSIGLTPGERAVIDETSERWRQRSATSLKRRS